MYRSKIPLPSLNSHTFLSIPLSSSNNCLPNLRSIALQARFLENGKGNTVALTSLVSPSRLFIHSAKALIVHLVSISGLSADNWSITPPPTTKSRNRRRRNTAMFRRRISPLAKHGRAAFYPFRPNGVCRRVRPFGIGPAPCHLAHAQRRAALT